MQSPNVQRQGGWYSPWSRLELRLLLPRAMELIGEPGSFVELRLCGDREIVRLNQEYLGLPGPTNVLSFPCLEAADKQQGLLGQICISLPAVERESVLYAQEPRQHMLRLLMHGILHLAGYPHGEQMQALTEQGVQELDMGRWT
ncbi:MAG: rRNA maturation RNase YbeY [Desulfohalobiaceae bacterium]